MHDAFTYCPNCGGTLVWPVITPGQSHGRPKCINCGFTDYHNPIPAVCAIVPYEGGVVLIQRKKAPFPGSWCLPCGFVDYREQPDDAIVREVREETGLIVSPSSVVLACVPEQTNELVLHYHTEVVGGELIAGDDAYSAAVYMSGNLPEYMPFKTHRDIIQKWFSQN